MKRVFKIEKICCAGLLLFFLGLGIFGPVGVYDDTASYQVLSWERDPFYGIFLWIFSFLEGISVECHLRFIVILQNVLMACAGISLLRFLQKKFRMKGIWSLLITGCLIVPYLLIPLATTSGMILCNSILSEGISIPVYLLFFTQMLKAVLTADDLKKAAGHGIAALLYGIVLCMSRGQLIAVLIAWLMVMGFLCVLRKKKKWLAVVLLLFVAGFGVKSLVNGLYNLAANDIYTGNTSESATMLAHSFFNADLEKEVTFNEPGLQAVYEEIKALLIENQLNQAYAPKGLQDFVLYYEECHDEIKFHQMVIPIHLYARSQGAAEGVDTAIRCNEIAGELRNELYLQNPAALLATYMKLAVAGLVRTVAYLHPIFVVYAVLIFALAIALTVWLLLRGKKGDTEAYAPAAVMIITLLLIAGGVFSTALVTACISRYVIYNMSVFYIAGLVLLKAGLCRIRTELLKGGARK